MSGLDNKKNFYSLVSIIKLKLTLFKLIDNPKSIKRSKGTKKL